jgi:alginate O-acetyltransferase complex protein AlgJ
MAEMPSAVRAHEMSREEIASIEVGHTAIRSSTAWVLAGTFVALIGAALTAQLALRPIDARDSNRAAWSFLAAVPREIATRLAETRQLGAWARMLAANRVVLSSLSAFETALDDVSALGGTLRPPAQLLMSRRLGAGNERVYAGRGGWLFYRPDVELLTAPGFLRPDRLARRAASSDEWAAQVQPDPRDAILQFKRDLDARGIALVVMPTPVKPTVHPERLASRFEDRLEPLQNPSFEAFVADLEREGVLVLDVSTALARAKAGGAQYLSTDTHWRPEAMELAAETLRDFVAARVPLPEVPDPDLKIQRVEIRAAGDTSRMLDLPDGQTLFPPEIVWLRRVLQADGTAWRPSRSADVLVLGDSFSNIYSLGSMGWGDSAGLVEQLAWILRRPIDRMVQNDEGGYATRAVLQREMQSHGDRLTGKRLVIYQFAARELASGDWRVLELPQAQ